MAAVATLPAHMDLIPERLVRQMHRAWQLVEHCFCRPFRGITARYDEARRNVAALAMSPKAEPPEIRTLMVGEAKPLGSSPPVAFRPGGYTLVSPLLWPGVRSVATTTPRGVAVAAGQAASRHRQTPLPDREQRPFGLWRVFSARFNPPSGHPAEEIGSTGARDLFGVVAELGWQIAV